MYAGEAELGDKGGVCGRATHKGDFWGASCVGSVGGVFGDFFDVLLGFLGKGFLCINVRRKNVQSQESSGHKCPPDRTGFSLHVGKSLFGGHIWVKAGGHLWPPIFEPGQFFSVSLDSFFGGHLCSPTRLPRSFQGSPPKLPPRPPKEGPVHLAWRSFTALPMIDQYTPKLPLNEHLPLTGW